MNDTVRAEELMLLPEAGRVARHGADPDQDKFALTGLVVRAYTGLEAHGIQEARAVAAPGL
jgi:hypothetical protein